VSEPVCSAPAVVSGWSVVTSVIVIGVRPLSRFASDSRTVLDDVGVKHFGRTPKTLPHSSVASSVMPPLNPSVGLLVTVVSPSWVTDTVTPPDKVAELAVNSSICSDPPPDTGTVAIPWYLKSANVADPAESTDVAAEAVRPEGAAASFRAALLRLEWADLELPGFPLAEGEALADAEGVGDGDGLAVPVDAADGLGDADGAADVVADGAGLAVVRLAEPDADGVGVGVGVAVAVGVGVDEGRQIMPRMQLPPLSDDAPA
jgi:hypothetical protein